MVVGLNPVQLAVGQGLNPLQLTRSRHEPCAAVLSGGHRECAGVWCALRACWVGSKSVLAERCCHRLSVALSVLSTRCKTWVS